MGKFLGKLKPNVYLNEIVDCRHLGDMKNDEKNEI